MAEVLASSVPAIIAEALDIAKTVPGVVVLDDPRPDPDAPSAWCVFCNVSWSTDEEGANSQPARLRVTLPRTFPYDEPRLFALDEPFLGHAHQSAESGRLCLQNEEDAPYSAQKLAFYLD